MGSKRAVIHSCKMFIFAEPRKFHLFTETRKKSLLPRFNKGKTEKIEFPELIRQKVLVKLYSFASFE